MCLSIAVNRPGHVLSRGEHVGFEWIVVHNGMGYRCGYVRVPVGHPWHGKDYDDVECSVHGGLTFSEPDKPCDKGGPDDAWWHGFDCAHCGDLPDPSLPGYSDRFVIDDGMSEIRTQDYVEMECMSLCEQAAKAAQ